MPKYLKTKRFLILVGSIVFMTLCYLNLPCMNCFHEKEYGEMIEKIKRLARNEHIYFELYNEQKEKIATIYNETDLTPSVLKQLVKNKLNIVSHAILPSPQLMLPLPPDL